MVTNTYLRLKDSDFRGKATDKLCLNKLPATNFKTSALYFPDNTQFDESTIIVNCVVKFFFIICNIILRFDLQNF